MTKVFASEGLNTTTKKPKKVKVSRFHLISGIINFCFGIIMFTWLFNVILEAALEYNFQLREGNLLLPFWKGLPIPIQSKFYLYEIQNSGQFLRGGKPILREHGPYAYDQYRKRKVIAWSKDKNKVKFQEYYKFINNRQLSNPSMNKRIRMLNIIYMMALALERVIIRSWGISFLEPIVGNVMNTAFRFTNEPLVDWYTPRQYLEGRNITLLGLLELISQPLKQLGIPVDLKFGQFALSGSSFGFVLMRGGGPFGPYEMYTGQNGRQGFNHFAMVMGKRSVQGYSPPCNTIYGSDGVFYGRNIEPNQTLLLFNGQLCRQFHLEYVGETRFAGVPVYEYTIPKSSFDQRLRKNHCFCSARNKMSCYGLSDLSACMGGIPLYISFPHFYGASEQLHNFESGLVPSVELHKTRLFIEPKLGITIGAYVRIQMNMRIEPHVTVPSLSRLRNMIMPLFWVEEGAVVGSYLQYLLIAGVYGLRYGVYFFLLLAFVGLLQISFAILTYHARRQEEAKLQQNISKLPVKHSKQVDSMQQLNKSMRQSPTPSFAQYPQVDRLKSEVKQLQGHLQLRSSNINPVYYIQPQSMSK